MGCGPKRFTISHAFVQCPPSSHTHTHLPRVCVALWSMMKRCVMLILIAAARDINARRRPFGCRLLTFSAVLQFENKTQELLIHFWGHAMLILSEPLAFLSRDKIFKNLSWSSSILALARYSQKVRDCSEKCANAQCYQFENNQLWNKIWNRIPSSSSRIE